MAENNKDLAGDQYKLSNVVWEITKQCNLQCIHCGTGASFEKREQELSSEEALSLIDQVAAMNGKKVTLSGGEPLLRSDWQLLAERVLDHGMMCGMISNGMLINEETIAKLDRLQKKGTIFLALSVDGKPETHNYIRNNKYSFDRISNALGLLRDVNFPVAIITQVNRLNIGELESVREFIFSFPNVYAWQIQVATPWGRAKENQNMIISKKQYLKLCDYIAIQKFALGSKIAPSDDIGYYTAYETIFRGDAYAWDGCHAGRRVIGVRSNGDITGCLSLMEDKYIEGNIRNTPLKEIWEKPDGFSYNRHFDPAQLEGNCAKCVFGSRCKAGCRNIGISIFGNPNRNEYCLHDLIEN